MDPFTTASTTLKASSNLSLNTSRDGASQLVSLFMKVGGFLSAPIEVDGRNFYFKSHITHILNHLKKDSFSL